MSIGPEIVRGLLSVVAHLLGPDAVSHKTNFQLLR